MTGNLIMSGAAKVGVQKAGPGWHLDVTGCINFTSNLLKNGVVFAGQGGKLTVDSSNALTINSSSKASTLHILTNTGAYVLVSDLATGDNGTKKVLLNASSTPLYFTIVNSGSTVTLSGWNIPANRSKAFVWYGTAWYPL